MWYLLVGALLAATAVMSGCDDLATRWGFKEPVPMTCQQFIAAKQKPERVQLSNCFLGAAYHAQKSGGSILNMEIPVFASREAAEGDQEKSHFLLRNDGSAQVVNPKTVVSQIENYNKLSEEIDEISRQMDAETDPERYEELRARGLEKLAQIEKIDDKFYEKRSFLAERSEYVPDVTDVDLRLAKDFVVYKSTKLKPLPSAGWAWTQVIGGSLFILFSLYALIPERAREYWWEQFFMKRALKKLQKEEEQEGQQQKQSQQQEEEQAPVSHTSVSGRPLPPLAGSHSVAPASQESPAYEHFKAFIHSREVNHYLQAREALVNSTSFNPYGGVLRDAQTLFQQGHPEEARQLLLRDLKTTYLLSPRAHFLLRDIASQQGDPKRGERQNQIGYLLLSALLTTGDGSFEKPYRVSVTSDAHEALEYLEKEFAQQSLVTDGGRQLDRMECTDGTEVWFDVTDVIRHADKDFG